MLYIIINIKCNFLFKICILNVYMVYKTTVYHNEIDFDLYHLMVIKYESV